MEEHIKLRLEYKRLIRSGNKIGAQKVLRQIWSLSGISLIEISKEVVKPIEEEKVKKLITDLSDLVLISGIGKKTVKDIKSIFKDINELKAALAKDNVGLRDDIVQKLKEELE